MTFAPRFTRLPPDAGVPFSGFEFAALPGRIPVAKHLQDFLRLAQESSSPALRILKGEWGEGKTEAYNRYIVPQAKAEGIRSYIITASSVANSLKAPSLAPLLESNPRYSIRFLSALFYAIRETEKAEAIPSLENFHDVDQWIETSMRNHMGDLQKPAKTLVFLDEFEDLILDPESLKEILLGIKGLLNGEYSYRSSDARCLAAQDCPFKKQGSCSIPQCVFEGSIFLVLSTTPDAYTLVRSDQEINRVFGSFGRRLAEIELPPVSRREGIQFLWDLTIYSYAGNLPSPLPYQSVGILHALHQICMGNPRNMVSLFTRLLNGAASDSKRLSIIDGRLLLEIIGRESVNI